MDVIYIMDFINYQDKYYFGKKCEMKCDKDCFDKNVDEDDRIDCCYVKSNQIEKKNFSIIIENYKDDNDFENYYLNLSDGKRN